MLAIALLLEQGRGGVDDLHGSESLLLYCLF